MTLTDPQRRALEIIRDNGPLHPREFAELMWPDSDGHKRHTKCGPYGSTTGGGMNLAAGGYLGKLRKMGLILEKFTRNGWRGPYILSQKGIDMLKESE